MFLFIFMVFIILEFIVYTKKNKLVPIEFYLYEKFEIEIMSKSTTVYEIRKR